MSSNTLQFLRVVRKMRFAQAAYLLNRRKADLIDAKRYEQWVDNALRCVFAGTPPEVDDDLPF